MRQRYTGFTLIEMLVVVGVLGLLAAILMPTLGAAKRWARETGIRAEIKAIETAAHMFRTDTGMFPPDMYYATTNMQGVRPAYGAVVFRNQFQHNNINDAASLDRNDSTKTLVYFLGCRFRIDGKYYGPYISFNQGQLIHLNPEDKTYRGCSGYGHNAVAEGLIAPGDVDTSRMIYLRCLQDRFGNTYIYDCHDPKGLEIQKGLGGMAHNEQAFDLWSLGWDGRPFMGSYQSGGSERDMGLARTAQEANVAKAYGNDIVNWSVTRW